MFKKQLEMQNGCKFSWVDLYNLCAYYGYSFDAIRLQNLYKRWTTDQIVDDLGNVLLSVFYSKSLSYAHYTDQYKEDIIQ